MQRPPLQPCIRLNSMSGEKYTGGQDLLADIMTVRVPNIKKKKGQACHTAADLKIRQKAEPERLQRSFRTATLR